MKRRELLKAGCAAALTFAGFPLGWTAAAPKKKQKVLYFTRSAGFEHSVVHRKDGQLSHSERLLTEMGQRAGFEVECTKDGRCFDGDLDQFDAIAFYTTGDLTRPLAEKAPAKQAAKMAAKQAAKKKLPAIREDSPPMSPAGKKRLLDAIAAGKGFIGFHAATDTFHSGPRNEIQTQPDPYIAMLGGEFVKHDQQQEASLLLVSRFPGAGELGVAEGLSFYEEWYALKNFAKDLHVILVQETGKMEGPSYQRPDFPVTWARMHGKGRVYYTSLGHREDIWTNPFFQAIALGGIAWALGNVQYDIKPNIDKVAPRANQLTR
jgi:type 1 glutamine amidotransferase